VVGNYPLFGGDNYPPHSGVVVVPPSGVVVIYLAVTPGGGGWLSRRPWWERGPSIRKQGMVNRPYPKVWVVHTLGYGRLTIPTGVWLWFGGSIPEPPGVREGGLGAMGIMAKSSGVEFQHWGA